MDDFVQLGNEIYKNDPFKVEKPILLSKDYKYIFFVIYDGDKPLCRAAGIENPLLLYNNQKVLQFGYFESYNDSEAVNFLIYVMQDYYFKYRYKYLIGPMNGSTWHSYRFTLPDKYAPFFLDNYHKSYYYELFEDSGFDKLSSYSSFIYDRALIDNDRVTKYIKHFEEKRIVIRNINLNDFKTELKKLYDLSICSFTNNFLYTPISFDEFCNLYIGIENVISPEFSYIAEDEEHNICGYLFACDNIFEKSKKSLVLKTLAVNPEPKFKGLGTLITEMAHKKAFESNYEEIIHALIHQDNESGNILSGKNHQFREYVILGKKI